MVSVFEKNINALREKNSNLASLLLTYIPDEVPKFVKENNSYNFIYKGKYLHNPKNPLMESAEIFAMAENSPVAIHFIFGIGLGYLFQIASAKSQGTVILYEPDLNILRMAFSLVDFSGDILKPNVFLTNDFEQGCEYIYQKSYTKNTPFLLTTNAYREFSGNNFDDLVSRLQQSVGRYSLDLKYTKEKFYPLIKATIKNIPKLINEIPIGEFKDRFKGTTAVIASAGPTLDKNIEYIKKYRDNIILITVGTAMKALYANDITPDFLCIIESNDCSKQIAGLDLSGVHFITEPFSNSNLRKFKYKNTYSHISSNLPINNFWCDITGIKNSEYLSKGTVSYTALNVARILGCKKIILAGQDLAYIEGQCYSKESAYKDLECRYNEITKKWEIAAKDFEHFALSLGNYDDADMRNQKARERIQALNSALYYVKGIKGDMIPTESVYAAFIQPLSEFTQFYPDRIYINTSLVGAQIDGFINMPIEEALKETEKISDRTLHTDFKFNIPIVKEKLFKSKESLKPALMYTEELLKTAKNLKNDLERYKNVTQEILKGLKKLSVGYTALSYDFSSKNQLYDYITTAERIELDYEMKMMRDVNFESVENIVNKIYEYAQTSANKTKEITEDIEKVLGEF